VAELSAATPLLVAAKIFPHPTATPLGPMENPKALLRQITSPVDREILATEPLLSSTYIRSPRMIGAVVSAPVIGTDQAVTSLEMDRAVMGELPASRVLS
jgi:hypothetical protein